MITGTWCRNAASALHRLPPIADALPYAARACLRRLRRLAIVRVEVGKHELDGGDVEFGRLLLIAVLVGLTE